MATTVFPVTDQSVTKASWDAMAAAINRGQESQIDAMSDSASTDRLIWQSQTSGTASADNTTPRQWIPDITITLGKAFFLNLYLSISETVTDGTNDDDLSIKITVPSGVRLIGTLETVSRTDSGAPTLVFHNSWFVNATGSTFTQALGVDTSNASPQNLSVIFSGVAVGDTATGAIEVDYLKSANAWSTEYTSGQSHAHGIRIW